MRRIRLREAHRAGVRAIVSSAVSAADWDDCLALNAQFSSAQRAPMVFSTLGLHPYAVKQEPSENDRALEQLAQRLADGAKIVALGECGLDFRDNKALRLAPRAEQIRVCKRQLELAAQHQLPVVLHCVRAHGALLELLEAHALRPSILHAYSGSAQHAQRLTARGHYLSFAANIMLNDAKRAHASVRACPAQQLLIETDSPDQCPAHRTPPNQPAYVVDVAAAVAALRGSTLAQIAKLTFDNATRAYDVRVST